MASDFAFAALEFDGRWYESQYQRVSRHEPHSAVTTLIQGVYEKYPHQARAMLRSRIYTTEIVPGLDTEMVKVSAKRITLVPAKYWQGIEIKFDGVIPESSTSGPLHSRDRVVSAEIMDRDGRVLAHAMNHNRVNKTLHAEVICIQTYWRANRQPIPRGAVIRTSLSPCRQCAAMIATSAEEGSGVTIICDQKDPGRLTISRGSISCRKLKKEEWMFSNLIPGCSI